MTNIIEEFPREWKNSLLFHGVTGCGRRGRILQFPREWKNSLLFHGVPVQDKENFYTKAKVVSEIIRKSLGVRREVMITGMTRLIPTENEVGGWPPMSVSFQYPEDRDEVLDKAGAVKGTNIQVLEGNKL